jgi:hypothetical protein
MTDRTAQQSQSKAAKDAAKGKSKKLDSLEGNLQWVSLLFGSCHLLFLSPSTSFLRVMALVADYSVSSWSEQPVRESQHPCNITVVDP